MQEYGVVRCGTSKELLTQYTTEEVFLQIRQHINARNIIKLQEVLGIFELDWIKVKNQPTEFAEWQELLQIDIVNAR
jgi:hypothetical protein